jgi:hypothetical protein
VAPLLRLRLVFDLFGLRDFGFRTAQHAGVLALSMAVAAP